VIFIGAETRRRLDEAWPVEDLGDRVFRNVEEPVRVFQLAVTLEVAAAPSSLAPS
jgi:class 3 adenylate cyclase